MNQQNKLVMYSHYFTRLSSVPALQPWHWLAPANPLVAVAWLSAGLAVFFTRTHWSCTTLSRTRFRSRFRRLCRTFNWRVRSVSSASNLYARMLGNVSTSSISLLPRPIGILHSMRVRYSEQWSKLDAPQEPPRRSGRTGRPRSRRRH